MVLDTAGCSALSTQVLHPAVGLFLLIYTNQGPRAQGTGQDPQLAHGEDLGFLAPNHGPAIFIQCEGRPQASGANLDTPFRCNKVLFLSGNCPGIRQNHDS